jgi:hypothetical protein
MEASISPVAATRLIFLAAPNRLACSTGPGYASRLPDTDLRYETPYTFTNSELQYTINFTTTGVYTVWLRSYASSAGSDSVYVGRNGRLVGVTGFAPSQSS